MKALRNIGFAVLFCGLAFAQVAQPQTASPLPSKEPGNFASRRQASRLAHEQQNAVQNPSPAPQPVISTPAGSQLVTAATPVAPPTRPTMAAPVAPRISYQNGLLTVVAQNSTLGDVLNAIHNATGAQIESSGGSGGERVAAKIGPASVRDVLRTVLEGSRYDYILLGAENDPERIARVILTPKTGGSGVATVNASGQAVGAHTARPAAEADDTEEEATEPAPKPVTPQTPNAQNPAAPGQVKTPEQLLEDLRR